MPRGQYKALIEAKGQIIALKDTVKALEDTTKRMAALAKEAKVDHSREIENFRKASYAAESDVQRLRHEVEDLKGYLATIVKLIDER